MYTWSRVLAAISKKCDPKVLVAEQVVWLDAACYRPHTLIWWRRLWIWLRHSSIGIATHWHTWALLHTFRIFFLSTPGCIHSHFVIPSVLSEAKMSFKTLPFPTKSYWLSNSLSSLCWSLSKVQIWWLGVSTGVQKINHRRCGLEVDVVDPCVSLHIFDIFVLRRCKVTMLQSNEFFSMLSLKSDGRAMKIQNAANSKAINWGGCVCWASPRLPQVSQHRCQPRNLLPLSPTFPCPPPMWGVISKSENPNCWS